MSIIFLFFRFFFIFFGIAFVCAFANAQAVDPDQKWMSIDTEYARFTFASEHQKLALDYVKKFEALVPVALELFGESPRKGEYIIQDNTDRANGSAQVFPRPTVRLFPALPLPTSTIGEFRDSSYELIFHEFTHVLNMEPSHGYARFLRYIFGAVARPNQILPRWYTEGLAVFTESYFSPKGGRLASGHLAGIARSLTLEDRWNDHKLSNIAFANQDWLGGSRFYLFGGLMWETLVTEKGVEVIRKLNQSYSRRLPLLLNGPLNKLYPNEKMTWARLWKKTKTRWKEKSLAQIDQLKQKPVYKGRRIPQKGYRNISPSISPNGRWMAYASYTKKHGNGEIKLVRRHNKKGFHYYKPRIVQTPFFPQKFSWHPNSKSFLFQSHTSENRYRSRFHLLEYDLKTKKTTSLVKNQSAIEGCYSPSGKTIYFVSHKSGQKTIYSQDKKTKKRESIYQGKLGENISSLICDTEEQILWVDHPAGEDKQVLKLVLSTKKPEPILKSYSPFAFSKDKDRYILTSAISGVQNIYISETLKGPYRAATNTLTHITSATLDPLDSKLYFTQYTADGPRIFWMSAPQWESLSDQPPQIEPKPGFSLGYRNASYPVTFGLGASALYFYHYPSQTALQSRRGSAWTAFRIPWVDNLRGSLRWGYNQLQTPNNLTFLRQGPQVNISYNKTSSQPWAISRETGWNMNLGYRNYLSALGNTSYREVSLNLGTYWSSFMPGRSTLYIGLNGSYVPKEDILPNVFGVTTLNGPFTNAQQINTAFLQRGYFSGAILAGQIANLNAEIRFPIANIFWGLHTPPGFLKRIYGSVVYDGSIFRGRDFITGEERFSAFDQWIHGGGLELNADVGLFSQLPLTLTFGLYHGLNNDRATGLTPFFTVRL